MKFAFIVKSNETRPIYPKPDRFHLNFTHSLTTKYLFKLNFFLSPQDKKSESKVVLRAKFSVMLTNELHFTLRAICLSLTVFYM